MNRRNACSSVLPLVLAVTLPVTLPAQTPDRELAAAPSNMVEAVGIGMLDGEVVGVGPGYRARFDRSTVTVALPGPREDRHRIRFELTGAGREHGPALALGDVPPRCADGVVDYDRGGLVERYEARRQGLKQSFVFAELPKGAGDLVVCGRITAPPKLHRADRDHLELGSESRPLLQISDVVGWDGMGTRVRGSLLLRGDVLEMRLPAAFVDAAVAPLVLDPFIGPTARLTTNFQDTDFDVAYDETNQVYLVVWARQFGYGGFSSDVLAQRVQEDGTLVGAAIVIATGIPTGAPLSVAAVNGADAFVVGYRDGVRAVDASNGSVSPVSGPANVTDVAGDAGTTGTSAVAVRLIGGAVAAYKLDVGVGGATVSTVATALVGPPGTGPMSPRVPAHGGADGRLLVVWYRTTPAEVRGAVLDVDTMIAEPDFVVHQASGVAQPRVDGDGRHWLVGYEQVVGGQSDLGCRTVSWDSVQQVAVPAPAVALTGGSRAERLSQVAWAGNSVVLSYRREFSTNRYSAFVGAIDPFTCLDCEGEVRVDGHDPTATRSSVVFASRYSGGLAAGEGGLAAWERTVFPTTYPFTSSTRSFVAPFRSMDGTVVDLGGGCGRGGTAVATCALTGQTEFYHRARGTIPAAPSLLLLGATQLGFPCGPCSIVPDPLTGVALATTTSAAGNAEVRTPIPASSAFIGAALLDQWLTLSPTSRCSLVNVDLSNALSVTIEALQ